MTQQLALPIEVPVSDRDYHPMEAWRDSVLCRRCGLMLMSPIHGLSTAELAAIEARKAER